MNPAAEARARVLAAHPEAVVVERGRTSIKHRLADAPDGRRRYALDCSIGPLHYGPSEDQEIDTAFAPSAAPWQWEMTHAGFEVRVLSRLDAGQVIEYRDGDEWVRFQPHALQYSNALDQIQPISMPGAVDAQVSDDTLTWPDGYGPGVSLSWQAQTARLAKLLTIDSPSALPPVEQYILDGGEPCLELNFIFAFSSGVTPYINGEPWDKKAERETQGLVEFRDGDGNVLWWFNLPRSWDAEGNEQLGTFRFKKQGNSLYVSHRVPLAFVQGASYPLVVDVTVDEDVGASEDDANESSAGAVSIVHSAVEIGPWFSAWKHGGVQFSGVTISAGATIDVAYLTWIAKETDSDAYQADLHGIDAANPGVFTTGAFNLTGRDRTTAVIQIDSTDLGNWTAENPYNSPSIVAVIEELVASYDYSSGSRMGFVFIDQAVGTGERLAYAHDGDSAKATSLHIEYTAAGGVAHEGSASLVGAGALSCIAAVALVAAAVLSGEGTLSASSVRERTAAASPSGEGTLSAAGIVQAAGAAALSGEGTLTADGEITGKVEGAASLSGQGTLTAAGVVQSVGATTLSGQGSLSAQASRGAGGQATLSGAGTLSAAALKTLTGVAALSGEGGLTSKATVSYAAVASLSGEGVLTVKSVVLYASAASLSGVGTLTAQGQVVVPGETKYGAAALSGAGTLAASAIVFAIPITDLTASYEPILALAASYEPLLALAASYKPIIELEASVA